MKISSLFVLLFLLFSKSFEAQKVSDYQYILLPEKFEDFLKNDYGLKQSFTKMLTAKKYQVISQNQLMNIDPCNLLSGNILNNSNMFRTRLILQFKDCKGAVIQEIKSTSQEKDFDAGFQDALKIAMSEVLVANPITRETSALVETQKLETTNNTVTEPVTKDNSVENNNSAAESFRNSGSNFQKILIGNGQFILVSGNSSVPFATFSNTTKSDVFRVKLQNSTMTIGYLENKNLVIEMPNSDGSYRKEIFVAN